LPVIWYQFEVRTLTISVKLFSRLTFLATLAAIAMLGLIRMLLEAGD